MTQPIPPDFHALTPSFTFKDSLKAIEFYKKAFGATVVDLFPNVDGSGTMHATMKIGNSMFMMGDDIFGPSCKSAEAYGGSPISLFLYVPDVDAVFARAVAAGGKNVMPVADMFWGDRAGAILDPFGYQWTIATHKRDMTKDQVRDEAKAFFASVKK